MRSRILYALPFLLLPSVYAQQAASLSPLVQKYVRVSAPKVVLEHVRVIDGTGQPAVGDRNLVIERGKIMALDAGSDTPGRRRNDGPRPARIYGDAGNRRHAQSPLLCRRA